MTFRLVATLIAFELEAAEEQERSETELQARETLMGILGHDLRTPLTAIALAAEGLLRHSPTAQPEALGILASARRATRMVRDLLDFTRTRWTGTIPIERSEVDFRRVAEKVVSEIRLGVPERDIAFHATGDCVGEWDADRVAQVVANLAANAVKYGKPDAPVDIVIEGNHDRVKLEVKNLTDARHAALEELFQPFRRGHRGGEGLGLGLYIVREIMNAHGGNVEATRDGEAMTFSTTWPKASRC